MADTECRNFWRREHSDISPNICYKIRLNITVAAIGSCLDKAIAAGKEGMRRVDAAYFMRCAIQRPIRLFLAGRAVCGRGATGRGATGRGVTGRGVTGRCSDWRFLQQDHPIVQRHVRQQFDNNIDGLGVRLRVTTRRYYPARIFTAARGAVRSTAAKFQQRFVYCRHRIVPSLQS